MQESLFREDPPELPARERKAGSRPQAVAGASAAPVQSMQSMPAAPTSGRRGVMPALQAPSVTALAQALPPQVRLGGSTWSYPGWAGLVWDRPYSESQLARRGLQAYSRHPLLRCVCVDRSFYRSLSASQYAQLAQQVDEDFRFIVKGPALVCDAQVRDEEGRGRQLNPAFLDPRLALQEFVQPAMEGLGRRLGALVFQLSPLPPQWLSRMGDCLARLDALLTALPSLQPDSPDGQYAIEVRDAQWLSPDFVEILRRHGVRYCLGLHPKLPPIEEQLWILRRLWPSPLVCRWNLHRDHGPFGYEEAEKRYGDYSQLLDPDPTTRSVLARVARATAKAGLPVYIGISNHAEGCAPLSAQALAEAIVSSPGPAAQGAAASEAR
ncbi:DUF72 domain-containing protein [Mitsuaria sp. WAJ17]|uniref:DUF72 domain-containing protein n=1 Tax=Mitsuaria sp. WAJ17 TaxID=2761452 RepID=UPI00160013F0|nr:DUF72 domain-containing protein [Mitsuaria sp. WAJ17]MBB2485467.1 DUF72 domain-containing protein [Mitsuaria sp. WAJ17]